MQNRTKIICTIGPTSKSASVILKMISAGMDCCRLNFSHGTYAEFNEMIKTIRLLSKQTGRHIAIIQDLQGPKIRVGELAPEGVAVKKGETLILSTRNKHSTIPIQYKHLPHEVKRGDTILIDDGMLELTVLKVNEEKTDITCTVVNGGTILTHKGINVPTASLSAEPFSAKDRRDLAFGITQGVDYVALSFVKNAADIWKLRNLLRKNNSSAKIIAKVERHEAITNIDEIVRAADAVMVARGDLGLEVPAYSVPLHQKRIIHLSNTYGKPVIVATQMLESMVRNPRPTRAEISDAATAIFDHADGLMLTNETAVGLYPVEATRTLAHVAAAVENDLKEHQHLLPLYQRDDMRITDATCLNATKLAQDIKAKFIIALSNTGYTAREIAKYRPFIPIIAFTPDATVARQLSLVWDIKHTFVEKIHIENPLAQIKKILVAHKLVTKGDEFEFATPVPAVRKN